MKPRSFQQWKRDNDGRTIELSGWTKQSSTPVPVEQTLLTFVELHCSDNIEKMKNLKQYETMR